ncbi:unnamed protein product [Amoebophrya sp. A120]|nr:unnamed protein product [Amoebophrya sp. A120]|eukprot:GSA120T00020665001.1
MSATSAQSQTPFSTNDQPPVHQARTISVSAASPLQQARPGAALPSGKPIVTSTTLRTTAALLPGEFLSAAKTTGSAASSYNTPVTSTRGGPTTGSVAQNLQPGRGSSATPSTSTRLAQHPQQVVPIRTVTTTLVPGAINPSVVLSTAPNVKIVNHYNNPSLVQRSSSSSCSSSASGTSGSASNSGTAASLNILQNVNLRSISVDRNPFSGTRSASAQLANRATTRGGGLASSNLISTTSSAAASPVVTYNYAAGANSTSTPGATATRTRVVNTVRTTSSAGSLQEQANRFVGSSSPAAAGGYYPQSTKYLLPPGSAPVRSRVLSSTTATATTSSASATPQAAGGANRTTITSRPRGSSSAVAPVQEILNPSYYTPQQNYRYYPEQREGLLGTTATSIVGPSSAVGTSGTSITTSYPSGTTTSGVLLKESVVSAARKPLAAGDPEVPTAKRSDTRPFIPSDSRAGAVVVLGNSTSSSDPQEKQQEALAPSASPGGAGGTGSVIISPSPPTLPSPATDLGSNHGRAEELQFLATAGGTNTGGNNNNTTTGLGFATVQSSSTTSASSRAPYINRPAPAAGTTAGPASASGLVVLKNGGGGSSGAAASSSRMANLQETSAVDAGSSTQQIQNAPAAASSSSLSISSPPKGSGPLFQCAVCSGLVYESQLEYHMSVCKEPDELLGVTGTVSASPTGATTDRGTSPIKSMRSRAQSAGRGKEKSSQERGAGRRRSRDEQEIIVADDDHAGDDSVSPFGTDRRKHERRNDNYPAITSAREEFLSPGSVSDPSLSPRNINLQLHLRRREGTAPRKQMDRQTRDAVKQSSARKWEEKRLIYKRAEEQEELAECTFRPNVKSSSKASATSFRGRNKSGRGGPPPGYNSRTLRSESARQARPSDSLDDYDHQRFLKGKARIEKLKQIQLQKELEECTFKPETNSELNNYILFHRRNYKNVEDYVANSLEQQNNERRKRRKELEQEVYKECTHKPTISEYAKQHAGGHSHRSADMFVEDEFAHGNNVYDRLYSAYTIAQTAKTGLLEKMIDQDQKEKNREKDRSKTTVEEIVATTAEEKNDDHEHDEGDHEEQLAGDENVESSKKSSSSTTKPGFATTSNKPQNKSAEQKLQNLQQLNAKKCSDLLYNDAKNRKERLREKELELRREEMLSNRANKLCSARSRRYYWHMLEKKVREAFEFAVKTRENGRELGPRSSSSTGTTSELVYSDLGVFLEKMGCLKPTHPANATSSSSSSSATTGINKHLQPENANLLNSVNESLKLSLWRYLDPEATGHTDLLSLTVFFHVLMGAVDEETFKTLRNEEENGQDAKIMDNIKQQIPSLASAPSMLGRTSSNNHTKGGEDASKNEKENHDNPPEVPVVSTSRVRDLVARYNPSKLRQEFYPLYFNRLHNNYQQQNAAGVAMSNSTTNNAYYSAAEEELLPESNKVNKESSSSTAMKMKQSNLHAQPATQTTPASFLKNNKGQHQRQSRQQEILANKVTKKQQKESGMMTHVDLMLWRKQKSEEKKQLAKKELERERNRECTFRPDRTYTVGGGAGGASAGTTKGRQLSSGAHQEGGSNIVGGGSSSSSGARNVIVHSKKNFGKTNVTKQLNHDKILITPDDSATGSKDTATATWDKYSNKIAAAAGANNPKRTTTRKNLQPANYEQLYERGMMLKEKKQTTIQQAKEFNKAKLLKECTFKPNMKKKSIVRKDYLKQQLLLNGAQNNSSEIVHVVQRAKTPPGYDEVTLRMRRAFDEKSELRRFQEERFPPKHAYPSQVFRRKNKRQHSSSPPARGRGGVSKVLHSSYHERYRHDPQFSPPPRGKLQQKFDDEYYRRIDQELYGASEDEDEVEEIHGNSDLDNSSVNMKYGPTSRSATVSPAPQAARRNRRRDDVENRYNYDYPPSSSARGAGSTGRSSDRDRKRAKLRHEVSVRRSADRNFDNYNSSSRLREVPPMPGRSGVDSEDEEQSSYANSHSKVLLYVDVNISPTQTERLVLFRGQKPEQAAKDFARRFKLNEKMGRKLDYLLNLQLENLKEIGA